MELMLQFQLVKQPLAEVLKQQQLL